MRNAGRRVADSTGPRARLTWLRPPGSPALRLALGLTLFLVLIETLAAVSGLPGVGSLVEGLLAMWRTGSLAHDSQVSGARWLVGWAVGSPVGILLGLLTGRLAVARQFLEGLFVVLRAVPFICLVPLSMLFFGLGEQGKVFLVSWAAASVCWVIVHEGAQGLPAHHRWRALSLAVPGARWFARILLPELSPAIFSSLRTSLSLALIVVAVAEMSGVYERSSGFWWSEGLGYRMFRSLDQARTDLLLAAIFSFTCLGILGDKLFGAVWGAGGRFLAKLRREHARALVASSMGSPLPLTWWSSDAPSIEVSDLSAWYGEKTVVDRVSLSVNPGETLCIVGPSGCGKTTLLRALARLEEDDFTVSGSVVLGGGSVLNPAGGVGIVLQEAPVFGRLTVAENIAVGGWSTRLSRSAVRARVLLLLREFGIDGIAAEEGRRISGGQRQRVALASAIAAQPKLLLLDEPFGALDAITRRRLQGFYCEHIHGRFAAVFVTHDIEEALIVGHRVRIGVARGAAEFSIDRRGLGPRDWELRPEFLRLRHELILALENEAGMDSGIFAEPP